MSLSKLNYKIAGNIGNKLQQQLAFNSSKC